MKKLDFLKLALSKEMGLKLAWLFQAFSYSKEAPGVYKKDPYEFRIVRINEQYKFIDKSGELVDIDDANGKLPLFSFSEPLTVDSSWGINIKEPVVTKIGNVVFNSVAIVPNFGTNFPFMPGKLNVKDCENVIAPLLTDTPEPGLDKDPAKIYVDDYISFKDDLLYFEQLAPLINWSVTRKNILPPTGVEEYKAKLLVEYDGRLNNPVDFAEYEAKLRAYDDEYLKSDPAYGGFVNGKIKDISRKKQYLAIGMPPVLDVRTSPKAIVRTLKDGQPTDPEEFAASINGARFGSFSRGSETKNGGVTSKVLIRVGSNFVINLEDCGTNVGIMRTYRDHDIKKLVGRTVIEGTTQTLVKNLEQASNYLNKPIILRSSATCGHGPNDVLCETCSGKALSKFKEGLVIPLTEISTLVLTQSLKAMHGKVLSTRKIDLKSVLT